MNDQLTAMMEELTDVEIFHLISIVSMWQKNIADYQPYDLNEAVTDSMDEITEDMNPILKRLKKLNPSQVKQFIIAAMGMV